MTRYHGRFDRNIRVKFYPLKNPTPLDTDCTGLISVFYLTHTSSDPPHSGPTSKTQSTQPYQPQKPPGSEWGENFEINTSNPAQVNLVIYPKIFWGIEEVCMHMYKSVGDPMKRRTETLSAMASRIQRGKIFQITILSNHFCHRSKSQNIKNDIVYWFDLLFLFWGP